MEEYDDPLSCQKKKSFVLINGYNRSMAITYGDGSEEQREVILIITRLNLQKRFASNERLDVFEKLVLVTGVEPVLDCIIHSDIAI